jgi:hypothetical protein
MYCANAVYRPSRRAGAKHGATTADLLAIEQRFFALDCVDNFQNADVLWTSGKHVAAPYTLRRANDAGLFQLWKNLGNKRGRYALKFGEFTTAQWRVV